MRKSKLVKSNTMYQIKLGTIIALFLLPCATHAQSKPIMDFITFVGKNFHLPTEARYSCEWQYAVVSVKTDSRNKIISYDILKTASNSITKDDFKFLIGYRFLPAMHIDRHPVVFHLTINNADVCKSKPGDYVYTPNQVVNMITSTLLKIEKDDPKTTFIPEMIIKQYYPPENKE